MLKTCCHVARFGYRCCAISMAFKSGRRSGHTIVVVVAAAIVAVVLKSEEEIVRRCFEESLQRHCLLSLLNIAR